MSQYVERVYYEHDAGCSKKDFWPPNEWGLKHCKECAGIFDKDGKGVCVTDKRFDRLPTI
jgi:hypothetical protein